MKLVESQADMADESVAETHVTEEGQNTRETIHDDKIVLRSKTAAFVVLGMAAMGLGLMIFFLTRGEEIDGFEEQVSSN